MNPHWGGEWKTSYCRARPYLVYILICGACSYQESTWKNLQTRLKKGNGRLGKLDIDTLDSSMMKKMATDLKTKGKKPGYTSKLRG